MSEEEIKGEPEPLFYESEARDIQLIVLMRIYDILMSDFILNNPEEGSKLYELHAAGGFLNPPPAYDASKIVD